MSTTLHAPGTVIIGKKEPDRQQKPPQLTSLSSEWLMLLSLSATIWKARYTHVTYIRPRLLKIISRTDIAAAISYRRQSYRYTAAVSTLPLPRIYSYHGTECV